jgi:hypothetical protein
MVSLKSCREVQARVTDNSPKGVGLADYLVFQTLSDVETLRRRITPPHPAISKLELRDSLARMRNTPLSSMFLAAGHIWFSGSTATVRIRDWCFFGGQYLWQAQGHGDGRSGFMEVSGARAGSFWERGFYFSEISCYIIKVTYVFDLEIVCIS